MNGDSVAGFTWTVDSVEVTSPHTARRTSSSDSFTLETDAGSVNHVSDLSDLSDLSDKKITAMTPRIAALTLALPELVLVSQRLVIPAGVDGGTITTDFFGLYDPDSPEWPRDAVVWIELLLEQLSAEPLSLRAVVDDWQNDTIELQVAVHPVTQQLALNPGWNLVSFKMEPLDGDPAVLFENQEESEVVGPAWQWDVENRLYLEASSLIGSLGYWVFIEGEEWTLSDVPGTPITDTVITTEPGWNLMGPVGDGTTGELPGPSKGVKGTVWEWKSDTQRYLPATSLREGRGYWLQTPVTTGLYLQLDI